MDLVWFGCVKLIVYSLIFDIGLVISVWVVLVWMSLIVSLSEWSV